MHSASKSVVIQDAFGVCIVRIEAAHVDHEDFDEIQRTISSHIETCQPARVLLNLRKVEYLHSVGLGLLAGTLKQVRGYGGALRLCSLQPELHELLTITHMHSQFDVYDTEPSAMADF